MRDLARALRQYNDIAAKGGWPGIDEGPVLGPGDHGPRVVQLRARLEAEDYLEPLAGKKALFFDTALRKALTDYQAHNGLAANGHLGTKTLEALNVPIAARLDQIRANMERWRHMPEDFPPTRAAIVNIPDFEIKIRDDDTVIYRGPVIVGQVERKTPFIQSVIQSMIINPAWHVPAKIARADILPKLRKDPHYLEKLGFVIRGSEYDPHGENIDWKNMPDEEFDFRLRQQPGKMNSLGRLKVRFRQRFRCISARHAASGIVRKERARAKLGLRAAARSRTGGGDRAGRHAGRLGCRPYRTSYCGAQNALDRD